METFVPYERELFHISHHTYSRAKFVPCKRELFLNLWTEYEDDFSLSRANGSYSSGKSTTTLTTDLSRTSGSYSGKHEFDPLKTFVCSV